MNEFYNRRYIAADGQGLITSGWSDGPHPARDTTGAICINEQGGYQFRLFPGGEENPPLYTVDGIPLYRWDGESAVPRTAEEIEAERVPSLESVQAEKLAQLSAACSAAITAGCDVELPGGFAGHISLTAEDQINLTNARAAVEAGAWAYPYHLDGELCALYPAEDILPWGNRLPPTSCITPPITITWRPGCCGAGRRKRRRPLHTARRCRRTWRKIWRQS